MPQFRTDEPLWYNVGVWGELGYACPNFGDDLTTLNPDIGELVDVMGRNLSAVMHHQDADVRVPPSINTLMRVHKLVTRARSLLSSRAVPPGKLRMEGVHDTPAAEDFLIYPIPYFKVRNRWIKTWGGLVLSAICEACQHTENRLGREISTDFAGLIGQYLQRIYVRMSVELFGVAQADAEKPDFTLTDAIFKTYDPSKFFTATELIDVAVPPATVPTEDDLVLLTDGIPASKLVGLQRYPLGTLPSTGTAAAGSATGTAAAPTAPTTGAFISPPSP